MIHHELRVRGRSRGFAVDDDVDLDLTPALRSTTAKRYMDV